MPSMRSGRRKSEIIWQNVVLHCVRMMQFMMSFQRVQEAGGKVLLNPGTINAKLMSLVSQDQILEGHDPSELMRAIKNETEVANTIEAHIYDGLAVTKFIHYLKTNVGSEPMTEISAGC